MDGHCYQVRDRVPFFTVNNRCFTPPWALFTKYILVNPSADVDFGMVKIKLNKKVLLRTPRFHINAKLKDHWNELKELIKEASTDFYQLIENITIEDLLQADEKVRLTIYKYFNRACCRATPYAGFAAVGLAEIIEDSDKLLIPSRPALHAFEEWSANLQEPTIGVVKKENLHLFANSTFYQVADEIRYLRKDAETYSISAIDFDPSVLTVLNSCLAPIAYNQLYQLFAHEVSEEDFDDFISTLVKLGLLLTSMHPNIIGLDYFERAGKTSSKNDKQYIIAERKTINGGLDQRLFTHLPELVSLLHTLLPANEPQDLTGFKQNYIRRFEQAEVPLMVALDPEIGVGYGEREQRVDRDFFNVIKDTSDEKQANSWGALKEQLYKQMLKEPGSSINLESLTGNTLPATQLPNSMAIGCTVVDDLLYLDFAGGATATSLLGRFALASPDIEQYCKGIAAAEQEANPDVLLFDVGYTKEGRVDNINRRPAIYNLQLNILNYDTSVSPLSISDVYVSVQGGQVILRSKTLNKRLLPRMATAYNYQRSELSLFRLLMDLQSQGLATNLSIRLPQLIAGLDFYPRLQFKNVVVSPASWLLTTKLFDSNTNREVRIKTLQNLLFKTGTARYVKAGTGDQTLCINTEDRSGVELLMDLLEKKKQLLIEEAGVPETPAIVDESRKAYLPQVIVTLQHGTPIVQPLTTVQETFAAIADHEWVAPGKDWLYFEIYTHPYRSDQLLAGLYNYLEQQRRNIKKWFFIRYNDNGNHIRLRLQLIDLSQGYIMIKALNELLEEDLKSGLVTDLKLCTYKKEVHRYLPGHMEAVEQHFYKDSEFVMSTVIDMLPEQAKYRLCMDLFNAIESSGEITNMALEKFLRKITAAHNQEHGMKPEQFKILNKDYKMFRAGAPTSLSINSAALYERLKASFIETISQYSELIRPKILGDLLHMHINRLFSTDQRRCEMIFYNFLLLQRKQRQHRFESLQRNSAPDEIRA